MIRYEIHKRHHLESKHISGCKCTKCGEMFQTETQLMRHVKNHDTIKYYNCPQCPKTFRYGFEDSRAYICLIPSICTFPIDFF